MNDPQKILSAKNLFKTYSLVGRSLEVLKGVDLEVEAGELLALRGASGAGKSTLLHLLGGLDAPNRGEIWFRGQNLARFSDTQRAQWRNRKVGFIFQAYHLFPELDALENVCLPARILRSPPTPTRARAEELLAKVGLSERMGHRPAELSGGEQQRVAIARAMINDPEIILADEPTGNLDSKTGTEIIHLLIQLREEKNTTLIIATHDANVAARAPKVIHLIDGQVGAA